MRCPARDYSTRTAQSPFMIYNPEKHRVRKLTTVRPLETNFLRGGEYTNEAAPPCRALKVTTFFPLLTEKLKRKREREKERKKERERGRRGKRISLQLSSGKEANGGVRLFVRR